MADTYDQAALLRRMIDLDRLADPPPPGEITGMFSSYDRKSKIDAAGNQIEWNANADWAKAYLTPTCVPIRNMFVGYVWQR